MNRTTDGRIGIWVGDQAKEAEFLGGEIKRRIAIAREVHYLSYPFSFQMLP